MLMARHVASGNGIVDFPDIKPLLMRTKLLSENYEVKFRWADILSKFRVRGPQHIVLSSFSSSSSAARCSSPATP